MSAVETELSLLEKWSNKMVDYSGELMALTLDINNLEEDDIFKRILRINEIYRFDSAMLNDIMSIRKFSNVLIFKIFMIMKTDNITFKIPDNVESLLSTSESKYCVGYLLGLTKEMMNCVYDFKDGLEVNAQFIYNYKGNHHCILKYIMIGRKVISGNQSFVNIDLDIANEFYNEAKRVAF